MSTSRVTVSFSLQSLQRGERRLSFRPTIRQSYIPASDCVEMLDDNTIVARQHTALRVAPLYEGLHNVVDINGAEATSSHQIGPRRPGLRSSTALSMPKPPRQTIHQEEGRAGLQRARSQALLRLRAACKKDCADPAAGKAQRIPHTKDHDPTEIRLTDFALRPASSAALASTPNSRPGLLASSCAGSHSIPRRDGNTSSLRKEH